MNTVLLINYLQAQILPIGILAITHKSTVNSKQGTAMKRICAHCNCETSKPVLILSKYSYLNGKSVCRQCYKLFVQVEIRNTRQMLERTRRRMYSVEATVQRDMVKL